LQVKLKVLNLLLLSLFTLFWYLLFHRAGLYQTRWLEDGKGEGKQIAKSVSVGSTLLMIVAVSFQRHNLGWDVILCFSGFTFVLTWVGRMSLRPMLRWLWQHNPQRLLLVGSNPRAHNFALHIMTQPQLGYHIVGYIDDPPNGQGYYPLSLTLKHLGALQDFEAVIEREIIDEVVVSLPMRSCYERIQCILEACEQQGIQAHLLSNFFSVASCPRADDGFRWYPAPHPIDIPAIPVVLLCEAGFRFDCGASLGDSFLSALSSPRGLDQTLVAPGAGLFCPNQSGLQPAAFQDYQVSLDGSRSRTVAT
jgi:FlaA1/EpsC-like NDP-sugar epimerase